MKNLKLRALSIVAGASVAIGLLTILGALSAMSIAANGGDSSNGPGDPTCTTPPE